MAKGTQHLCWALKESNLPNRKKCQVYTEEGVDCCENERLINASNQHIKKEGNKETRIKTMERKTG